MDAAEPFLFSKEIVMRWGDMDALGHLNNTYYFRYMEQARVEWLDEIAMSIVPGGVGPVIASSRCDFRKELVYPATVRLNTHVRRVGGKSLTLAHLFTTSEHPDTLFAEGEVTLVWVDYRSGQSVPLPDAIRQRVTFSA